MSNIVTPKTNSNSPKRIWAVILLALPFFFMSTKCQKDNPPPEPELPPATQTGANTFGCKVNGKVYVPNGNIYNPSIDQPSYHTNDGSFWIRTRNLDDFEDNIYIYIYIKSGAHQTDIYPGYEDNTYPCIEKEIDTTLSSGQQTFFGYNYFLDTTENHFIKITRLDIENKIISGLFEFTCFSETQQDTFEITEGRFDVAEVVVQP